MAWAKGVLLASALVAATPSLADPTPRRDVTATGSIERHHTSNAFDSENAVADWYSLLRGSFQNAWQLENGSVEARGEFQITRHDDLSMADDRAFALSLEGKRQVSERAELRGALTYGVTSEGDALEAGPLLIGMRTGKQRLGASAGLSVDLGDGLALILDVSDTLEHAGKTRFDEPLLDAQKLDPDTNRFQTGARIAKALGPAAIGASASMLLVAVEKLGDPPSGLSLAEYTVLAETGLKAESGATINAAAGIQLLRGTGGIYERARPTYRVGFLQPLAGKAELRGSFVARYETLDSDDPLASWLRRADLEAGYRVSERVTLASGVFAEIKDNLLFETLEHRRGIYAEADIVAAGSMAIVFRVDYAKTFITVVETERSTLDASVAIRSQI